MPDRSVKMKRRIFGFQRRVWWPKCTPASSSSRIEATAMCVTPLVDVQVAGGAYGAPVAETGTRASADPPGRGVLGRGKCSEGRLEVGREPRLDLDAPARERMVE